MSDKKTSDSTELVAQHHFFISTISGWSTSPDMITAINRVLKPELPMDYVSIWRVPLPESAAYRIENYGPVVEGAELIYLDNGGARNHPDTEVYVSVATFRDGKLMENWTDDGKDAEVSP